ncbi:LacI family DNA-binding transcriptional regulator [Danxiaibacter flavus]|uniref:LacI family DNA-binding transcriptional regulator n=1 Tax=Danxiaibacter flavus TaxID=3049108 RepID=A0ABV3Z9Y3_9BACT|nr:LacI family DNA-binding transcriptional regulator [Chitinophagaceae bacterium DXS]
MKREKEVTIYDLARIMKISPATVSRGLKNHPAIKMETKNKIQELAKELGYRSNNFASNLRQQKTHTIGVIVHELNSNFITSVLAGIEKVTTESGYDLIIGHSSETSKKEAANANNLFHKRVDGLLASLAYDTESLQHYDPFLKKGIPVVFFDRVDKDTPATKVVIDNYAAGYAATKHLIDEGCKRIAHITASLKRNVYNERLQGYKQALNDNALCYKEELVIINDLSEHASIEAADTIASMNPMPDGIFITNDFCAAVVMQTLKEKGIRIPEDIAVVGFNNDVISKIVEPRLTTINYPGIKIGEAAALKLVEQLRAPHEHHEPEMVFVDAELIVRKSSLKKK